MVERKSFYSFGSFALGVASELAAPALRLYSKAVCPSPPTPPREWRRGLILGATRIGDVLYRTPSLQPLAEGLPECRWHYLAEPSSAEILKGNPHLAEVHPWAATEPIFHVGDQHLRKLREFSFDVALCTDVSRYHTNLRLALKLGIPSRAGFTLRGLSAWVTHPVPLRYPCTTPDAIRQMVAHVTGKSPDWPLQPVVHPSAADREAASTLWRELKLSDDDRVVAVFLSTRHPSQIWPPERVAAAFEMAAARPMTFVLVGSASDETAARELSERLKVPHRIACGRLSLLGTIEFLKKCRAVYTPDSGPRHLANAAGTPVVFIRNPSIAKEETGCYCSTEIDVSPDVGNLPHSEHAGYFAQVTPKTVAQKLLEAVDRGSR